MALFENTLKLGFHEIFMDPLCRVEQVVYLMHFRLFKSFRKTSNHVSIDIMFALRGLLAVPGKIFNEVLLLNLHIDFPIHN